MQNQTPNLSLSSPSLTLRVVIDVGRAILFLVTLTAMSTLVAQETPVRVMSYNIRYGTAKDGVNHWDLRKEKLVKTISDFAPDLLGTQETLEFQRDYLLEKLKEFEAWGVGRDDGKSQGEMAALFYRRDRFEKLTGGHFWLSPQPDTVGSKGWDAALPRIASWVRLRDRITPGSKPIFFCNTHFDHRGETARLESAKLIRQKVNELAIGCRIIITGDFNTDYDSAPYRALMTGDSSSEQTSLLDTYLSSSSPHPNPDTGTFSNFDATQTRGSRIDWIACSKDWDVRLARIDRTQHDGHTPSDHFPVVAVLRSARDKDSLRVLTFNVHHCRGLDNQVDIARVASVIRNADPDILVLQELDRFTKRTNNVDQVEELARLTGYHAIFEKAIDFEGGEYGQAIMSLYYAQYPIKIDLPNEANREQRICVHARIDVPSWGAIRMIGTHLDHQRDDLRLLQAQRIMEEIDVNEGSSILAGDLNCEFDSNPLKLLLKRWKKVDGSKPTYPAENPTQEIDFILLSSKLFEHQATSQVLDGNNASDHRPVLVEILKDRP